ncbi:hypothetical protein QQF64_019070 [Cirrhinus molitorella]|uniref:Uncharacterized protein n=1 Tax=Cirrhinus molitorella TaxID=172907 RepID=A0ABR3LHU1_9TELE
MHWPETRVRDDVRSDDTAHQRHEAAAGARTEAATAGTGRDAPNPADAPVHRILRKKDAPVRRQGARRSRARLSDSGGVGGGII